MSKCKIVNFANQRVADSNYLETIAERTVRDERVLRQLSQIGGDYVDTFQIIKLFDQIKQITAIIQTVCKFNIHQNQFLGELRRGRKAVLVDVRQSGIGDFDSSKFELLA